MKDEKIKFTIEDGIARIVDDDRFEEQIETVLQRVANAPANAVGRAKRLLRSSLFDSLEQQLELELYSISSIASSPETLKTLEAFFEQRKK
jgi:enoyl-CoA hydratase/carnithine racemase